MTLKFKKLKIIKKAPENSSRKKVNIFFVIFS